MDKQEASALTYRLKQLENNIEEAESSAIEAELHIQAVYGHLKNSKEDAEQLRNMINQWKLQEYFQSFLQRHTKR